MADELDPKNATDDVRRRNEEGRTGEEEITNRASEDEEFEDIDEADENEDEDELES